MTKDSLVQWLKIYIKMPQSNEANHVIASAWSSFQKHTNTDKTKNIVGYLPAITDSPANYTKLWNLHKLLWIVLPLACIN